MPIENKSEFERELAYHTAPAMLGVKPANLLALEGSEKTLHKNAENFNKRAAAKGLKIKELSRVKGRTLMLLYNERLLEKQLCLSDVKTMFCRFGYKGCCSTCEYLERLARRIGAKGDFPHEIGLFLGYPTEDVKGFIENKGENYLCCGYWKVYSDEEGAKKMFRRFNNCRSYIVSRLDKGDDIYKALRIPQ